ncbi:cytochrome aa3 quinol oxidase subunit II [Radiobacillus deserti]|uniref:Quinol oxidase subunit 2 n=1 Tax=Radiobacillus deserti TaxID=2594883 RepID=A0A516KLC4_9BACI|nr:cytochrome aa3 quinol oxidase subunit II [Radiobacillus deserti]QDP42191.1 cytochrome aa3 quinol oxidase subunit II [Radiobacillus deserti]
MRFIKYIIPLVLLLAVLTGCETNMVVLDPQGPVAKTQANLIIFSMIMMAVVVIVVFALFAYIVWKYREKPENMDKEPEEEEGSKALEITWFVIPVIIVAILSVPTVMATYDLEDIPEAYDHEEPLVIHVTSADWKWIFSYPEQGIETVNYLNIPEDTPVLFKLTSTGTMQSFWVPALGGQKYTMANMETKLYLVAENPGTYLGRNTNFNGKGYAHMDFEVESQTSEDFNKWVQEVKETAPTLTKEKYVEIVQPGQVGRMTFNDTHLQWFQHSNHHSELLTDPEDYEINHGASEEHPEEHHSEDMEEEMNHEHDHGSSEDEQGGESE